MSWNKLSRFEQAEARRIRDALDCEVTVSQIAKYLDDFTDFMSGAITADQLHARTGHRVTAKS